MRLIALFFLCLAVVSCGKKGDLMPPPGYEAPAK